jgi:hypothetical protein
MRPILAALLIPLAACAAEPPPPPLPTPATPVCAGLPGAPGITARLYFGRSPGDAAAWQAFLAERVTPRFPSGFTVIEASGQWQQRSSGRIIRQSSTVIEIAAPRSPEVVWKLEEIRADYRQVFRQESVGLVVGENCFSF